MNSCYGLRRTFLTFNRQYRVFICKSVGTFTRQSVLCYRAINKQHTLSRRFTTCARAYVKSVPKFGRKIREKLIAMSGDSSEVLAPLQAAVKEKVRVIMQK